MPAAGALTLLGLPSSGACLGGPAVDGVDGGSCIRSNLRLAPASGESGPQQPMLSSANWPNWPQAGCGGAPCRNGSSASPGESGTREPPSGPPFHDSTLGQAPMLRTFPEERPRAHPRPPWKVREGVGRRAKTGKNASLSLSLSLSISVCVFNFFFQIFSIIHLLLFFPFLSHFSPLARLLHHPAPPSLPSQRPAVSVHIPHPDIASKLASSQMPGPSQGPTWHARLGSTARPRRIWPDWEQVHRRRRLSPEVFPSPLGPALGSHLAGSAANVRFRDAGRSETCHVTCRLHATRPRLVAPTTS